MKRNIFLTINALSALALVASALPASAAEMEESVRVLSTSELTEQVSQPRQECTTETIQSQGRSGNGGRNVAGSVIGGLAGGILGNQIGGGNGRTAATAVGAVTGALVGDRMQNDGNEGPQTVQRCRTVNDYVTRVTGYSVTYDFHGKTFTDTVPFRPGRRMLVRTHISPIQ